MSGSTETKTALYEAHIALGAKMVPFGGFVMPLQYSGQIKEHQAVREALGLFDLSHMGEFRVRGPGALDFVDSLVTNRVTGTEAGQVVYSPMCLPQGGIVDDLLVYHLEDSVLLVVNAANIEKDRAWVQDHLPAGVHLEDESPCTSLIAVQGPQAEVFLEKLTSAPVRNMAYYTAVMSTVCGRPALISRTGYTGEDGFELYLQNADAGPVWNALLEAGEPQGMLPVGLAARDTLRFEVGYCLYGNDIDDTTTPLEAGLGWTVKLGKERFIGREALVSQKESGLKRRLAGIRPLKPKTIPRRGCELLDGEEAVGRITSGTYSPSCDWGLGMGYVASDRAAAGTRLQVDIRGRRQEAEVVNLPFYTQGTRKPGKKRIVS